MHPAMQTLDFWFDFSCPYAYLASTQIETVAARTGATLRLRPMLLGGVFRARSVPQNLMAALSPPKARHNARDLQRWAARWQVPLRMPAGHPFRTVTALRAMLAVGEPYADLMHRIYRAYWVEGRDISAPEMVRAVLDEAGHDGAAVLERAQDQAIKDDLRRRTDEAIELGAFGAPTMITAGETLSWGQDRLDEVERLLGGAPEVLPDAAGHPGPVAPIDFWFDYSSPFACLASLDVTRVLGEHVRWRPMLLGAVFREVGTANVPLFTLSDAKRRWLHADATRRAERTGYPFRWPSRFPMKTTTPLRATLAAQAGGADVRPLVAAIYRAYWCEDRDISRADVVADCAADVGLDAAALLERADSQETRQALFAATTDAVGAGVFGAPSFVVHHPDGAPPSLYWGSDRMELTAMAARGDERVR